MDSYHNSAGVINRDVTFAISVKDKLRWLDAVAFDSEVSATEFRVAYAIGWHLNRETGEARPRRKTIAARLDLSVRCVEKAIAVLEHRGHLQVIRKDLGAGRDGTPAVGGRGGVNRYRLMSKRANEDSPIEQERANHGSHKGEQSFAEGRTTVRSPLNPASNPVVELDRERATRNNCGTRITDDWNPTKSDIEFAQDEGLTDSEITKEASRFKYHWQAEAGSNAMKANWSAAWRKWLGNRARFNVQRPHRESAIEGNLRLRNAIESGGELPPPPAF